MSNRHQPATHSHDVDLETTIDFLNTLEYDAVSGDPNEHLNSLGDAIGWLSEHDLIHDGDRPTGRAADAGALARITHVRESLREIADAVVENRPADAGAIDEVNRALREREVVELVQSADGVTVGHRHVGDPIDDALARVAQPLVAEIASGNPDRLRICANDNCRWVFYDESRAGRRRWCDMSSCGNRAKAARFRQRRRVETTVVSPSL